MNSKMIFTHKMHVGKDAVIVTILMIFQKKNGKTDYLCAYYFRRDKKKTDYRSNLLLFALKFVLRVSSRVCHRVSAITRRPTDLSWQEI